jgi:hypothetical protein
VASLVGACDLIPGTDANFEKRAKDRAAQLLIDPSSAQFHNVQAREKAVCGEINGKNRMGAYVGFSRFYVDVGTGSAAIDPQFDFGDFESARSLCASLGGSSCTRAIEEEAKRLAQLAFDAFWRGKCDATKEAASSAPYDPTSSLQVEENWTEEQPGDNKQVAQGNSDEETWFEAPDPDTTVNPDDASIPRRELEDGNAAASSNSDAIDQDWIDHAIDADGNHSR